jgi:hypothetical protein
MECIAMFLPQQAYVRTISCNYLGRPQKNVKNSRKKSELRIAVVNFSPPHPDMHHGLKRTILISLRDATVQVLSNTKMRSCKGFIRNTTNPAYPAAYFATRHGD